MVNILFINFKKIFYFIIIAIAIFFFLFLVFNQVSKNISQIEQQVIQTENIKYVKIAGQNIKVDLALTKEVRGRGLSGRSELGENEGMLFVFDYEDRYPFWMKDMNFAIDIIWISKDLKIIYIKKDALPESYPENFLPEKNAKYVLEVSAGFSEKNNFREGSDVLFTY